MTLMEFTNYFVIAASPAAGVAVVNHALREVKHKLRHVDLIYYSFLGMFASTMTFMLITLGILQYELRDFHRTFNLLAVMSIFFAVHFAHLSLKRSRVSRRKHEGSHNF